MKKLLALILAITMVFCFAACGQTEDEPEGGASVANPAVEYASLDEINEALMVKLAQPEGFAPSDEYFAIINETIAEYQFTLDGRAYTMRACPDYEEDISGVYVDSKLAFEGNDDNPAIVFADDVYAARWYTMDGQYTLVCSEISEMAVEEFSALVDSYMEATSAWYTEKELEEIYKGFEGNYTDSVSQRAVMEMVADGSNGLICTVHWGSSAEEATEWDFTLKVSEDGLMSYNDCGKYILTADENGEMQSVGEYIEGEGYFTVTNGTFLWDGAYDEECRSCAFEKDE